MENKLEKIKEYVKKNIEEDFDFEVEHWDNGNYDDSYQYGVDSGVQYTLKDILEIIESD